MVVPISMTALINAYGFHISKKKTGIRMDWTLNCPCHGKSIVDGENGSAKNAVLANQMKETDVDQTYRLDLAWDVYQYLDKNLAQPTRNIFNKKGVGITVRFSFFIPVAGPESVNRNILHCKTLNGSKPYRQFVTVSADKAGVIFIRIRSCHACASCRANTGGNAHEQCLNRERCGDFEQCELEPERVTERRISRRHTHNFLKEKGAKLAVDLRVGDAIIVALPDEHEPWMLAVVTKPVYELTPENRVVEIRKFEPIRPGASQYLLTTNKDKVFSVSVEDVRRTINRDDFAAEGAIRRSTRSKASETVTCGEYVSGHRYQLKPTVTNDILQLIPEDVDLHAHRAAHYEVLI
jgi:hypothetical protein